MAITGQIQHPGRCLESLHRNPLAADSVLYIFIDGPKPGAAVEAIAANAESKESDPGKNGVVKCILKKQRRTKDLSKANVEGVTKSWNQYGKIIAEDDNFGARFLQFMNDALNFMGIIQRCI